MDLKKIAKFPEFFFEISTIFGQILAIFGEILAISKSITQKILVGGIYGWSPMIGLIESFNLSPHLP